MKVPCAYCKKILERITSRAKGRCYCNTKHQMLYEYKNKIRNPQLITEKAHETLRQSGHYKRDNTYLKKHNPARTLKARRINSEFHKKYNSMTGRVGKLHHAWKGGKIWWRGKQWDTLKVKIRIRDKNKCVKCGMTNKENIKRFKAPLQVDHIRPFRETKDNNPKNLQTLCNPCHGKKSGRGQ